MRILNGLKLINGLICVSLLAAMGGPAMADINIDGQVIPAGDISSIAILPASGDLNIITIPGYTVTKDGAPPPPPGSVVINSFTASPATITEGGSTSLSWNTSNAVSCTPTGGAGGWVNEVIGLPSGNVAVTIVTAGTYTFTLTCDGATPGDTDTRNTVITVNVTPPPPQPGTCDPSPLTGVTTQWADFWGVGFPLPRYANVNDSVSRKGYVAYEFNTGNVVDNGKLVTVGNTQTSGVRLGAVSECPGDFNVKPECDHVWGIGGGINWATDGKSGACKLDPNTTYYFNVTFTDGLNPNSTTCSSAKCVVTIQHVNF